jgi:hypothetical protein
MTRVSRQCAQTACTAIDFGSRREAQDSHADALMTDNRTAM